MIINESQALVIAVTNDELAFKINEIGVNSVVVNNLLDGFKELVDDVEFKDRVIIAVPDVDLNNLDKSTELLKKDVKALEGELCVLKKSANSFGTDICIGFLNPLAVRVFNIKDALGIAINDVLCKDEYYSVVCDKFLRFCLHNEIKIKHKKEFILAFVGWLFGDGDNLKEYKKSKKLIDFVNMHRLNGALQAAKNNYIGLDIFLDSLFADFDATIKSTNARKFFNYAISDVFYFKRVGKSITINHIFLKELMVWYLEVKLKHSGGCLKNFKLAHGSVAFILKKYGYSYTCKLHYCKGLERVLQRCYIIKLD